MRRRRRVGVKESRTRDNKRGKREEGGVVTKEGESRGGGGGSIFSKVPRVICWSWL